MTSPPTSPATDKSQKNHKSPTIKGKAFNGSADGMSVGPEVVQRPSSKVARRIVPSGMQMYEDDLSNIDVKSLVGSLGLNVMNIIAYLLLCV